MLDQPHASTAKSDENKRLANVAVSVGVWPKASKGMLTLLLTCSRLTISQPLSVAFFSLYERVGDRKEK